MKHLAERMSVSGVRPRAGKFNITLDSVKRVQVIEAGADLLDFGNLPIESSGHFSDRVTDDRIKKIK